MAQPCPTCRLYVPADREACGDYKPSTAPGNAGECVTCDHGAPCHPKRRARASKSGPDGALRAVAGDDERAARATFEPFSKPNRWGETGTWLGPWETMRCEHGRLYSYRWTVRGTAEVRPTRADFEGGEPEYGSRACRKCHPEED